MAAANQEPADDVRTADDTVALLDSLLEQVSQAAGQDQRSYEIVLLDSSLEDADQLLAGLRQQRGDCDYEILQLDPQRNGLAQITEALAQRQDVDALHIVSRGTDRGVQLGSLWLSPDNLDQYRAVFQGWGYALSEQADLRFYGCDLAASDEGRGLLADIAALTGADVAVSGQRSAVSGQQSAVSGQGAGVESRESSVESQDSGAAGWQRRAVAVHHG